MQETLLDCRLKEPISNFRHHDAVQFDSFSLDSLQPTQFEDLYYYVQNPRRRMIKAELREVLPENYFRNMSAMIGLLLITTIGYVLSTAKIDTAEAYTQNNHTTPTTTLELNSRNQNIFPTPIAGSTNLLYTATPDIR